VIRVALIGAKLCLEYCLKKFGSTAEMFKEVDKLPKLVSNWESL